MSKVFNEFDLMEKGEAGKLKDAPTFDEEILPTSPSSARTTDKSLLSPQTSTGTCIRVSICVGLLTYYAEKRPGFPWLASLSSTVSSKTQKVIQREPPLEGRETVVRVCT